MLLGISDEIALPAGEAGVEPGGALLVRPFVMIKELDRCSPPLFRALVNRENISLVEIRLFDRQGVHFFTIRLEDAFVTRISRAVRSHGLHEEVAFAYRGIQLVDERSGTSASPLRRLTARAAREMRAVPDSAPLESTFYSRVFALVAEACSVWHSSG